MNQSPIEPGGCACQRKQRTGCATTVNGTRDTPRVTSTAYQGVAGGVAEYCDIPPAALRCSRERIEFLPECHTVPGT